MATESGGHRERRQHDGRDLAGPLAARAVPAELQAERVLHVGRSGAGEAGRAGAHRSRVAGEAVDVLRREPGVGDRGERGFAGQVEVGAEEPPADL